MIRCLTKCIVDTNVAVVANLATKPESLSDVPDACVGACVHQLEAIITKGGLVLDAMGEIFQEYLENLGLSGQPGVGYAFAKWVHDHQWDQNKVDRIEITKNSHSYDQFPDHKDLALFDAADRKFIAVSNAHPKKPPVLQATDSKWWGFREALAEVGITVHFLCPDYVKDKYTEKMGA